MSSNKKPSKKPQKKPTKKAGKKTSRSAGNSQKFSDKKFVVGADRLPEICVLTVNEQTEDGELLAIPLEWKSHKKPPHISVLESGRGKSVTIGDRILVKLRTIRPHFYQASVIRILENEISRPVVGVFVQTLEGGIIEPISRKMKESFMVSAADTSGALNGELVSGQTIVGIPSLGMGYAKITERLGRVDSPRAASLIASAIHSLPNVFSQEALAEAEAAPLPILTKDRADLRNVPLVTIDGEDARDFDDAVFAEPDGDGFHIIVAIAEVAFYVEEGSALDKTAFERGNSVYFPDRVIPMLPERLSNGLCSLVPNEDRYCLAVHIWIDSTGEIKKYEFVRGIMRSVARLTYESFESGVLSTEKENNSGLNTQISALKSAYSALAYERDNRGALDLDLPEYKIHFDAAGNVANIAQKKRLESHRLIECFMIAANVAAADFLLKHKMAGIYRVHEAPSEEKLEDLRSLLLASDYRLQKGAVTAKHFNRVLKASAQDPRRPMIHTVVLRSQMQAFYSAENLGHFGLSLQKYCHFTSPIRRYSDLVVHRSIVKILNNEKNHTPNLADTALHISETERRAMLAERDAADRYKVSFMSRKIGEVFSGVIGGLNEYGLFVSLNDTGVTGFVPVRNLGRDFFTYDKKNSCFRGRSSGAVFALGANITIRVQEANALTGSLIFVPEAAPMQGLPPLREKYKHGKKSPKHGKDVEKYRNKSNKKHNKKHVGKPRKKR
ncbi:MAG: ribonuclease R [Pseudomonadota bacterium]